MLRILLLLIFIVSCASPRTKYQKYSKKAGGYQEKVLDDSLRVVNFKANSRTKPGLAEKFAQFRAVEICLHENYKLAHILDIFDKTEAKTVTRTASTGYPSYYYGMSPFYGRYSSFGFGFGMMNSSSWNETVKYPEIEAVFECANEVYEPAHKFREVPAEEMKHLVKDLRGGLQVEKISKEAMPTELKSGDILLFAEGERVQKNYQLLKLFDKSKDHNLKVSVLRDGQLKEGLTLQGVQVTDKIMSAQKDLIKSVCKKKELKDNKICKS